MGNHEVILEEYTTEGEMSDCRRGFKLDVGFVEHIYTQLGTTSNYSIITDLPTLKITTAPAKPFQPAVSSPTVTW
jgi:hypothetical protein